MYEFSFEIPEDIWNSEPQIREAARVIEQSLFAGFPVKHRMMFDRIETYRKIYVEVSVTQLNLLLLLNSDAITPGFTFKLERVSYEPKQTSLDLGDL